MVLHILGGAGSGGSDGYGRSGASSNASDIGGAGSDGHDATVAGVGASGGAGNPSGNSGPRNLKVGNSGTGGLLIIYAKTLVASGIFCSQGCTAPITTENLSGVRWWRFWWWKYKYIFNK